MSSEFRQAVISRTGACLLSLVLVLFLAGCSLGDVQMPAPPAGVAADRSVGTVMAVPNPIPHSLEGREECFTCHAIGAVDAPPVPPDHEEEVTLCTTCHAVWLAPAIAAAAPPAIPHPVEDRQDCLVCHKVGTADAPRIPDNHDGLTGDICQTCHTQMTEISQDSEEEGPVAEIPSIPHGLEGFSACTSCHAEGGSGVPRMPDDHEGRTDDICSACHQPLAEGSEVITTPPAETATVEATETPTVEPTGMPTMEPTETPTAEATEATETPTAETPTVEVTEATKTPTAETPTVEVTEATETPSPATGDATNGETLYGGSCAVCHGPAGEGTSIAPDPINDEDLLAELSDEDLITIMREGVEGKMPAQSGLDDEELLDLVAFLRSW
jgi:mono/diheme cytochrome c family protein